MRQRILSRRSLATAAIALAAAVGSLTGVSLAEGGGVSPAASATAATSPPAAGILADVHRVLAGLVADGTIDQQQADAVQRQADAGSVDPKQLVDSGTLSDAQMRAVATQIEQVKRSYGR